MITYDSIPKYPHAYYMVNYEIERIPNMIEHFKEGQERFNCKFELNPDFQRGYVWTQKQKISYMEHILMEGSGGRDIYFNHPEWQRSYKADMVCLDGLQRLTTILEFLDNKISVFGNNYYKDFGLAGKVTKLGGMSNKLNIHVLNLRNRKDILFWYLQFNSGGTVHSEKDLSRVRKMLEEEND